MKLIRFSLVVALLLLISHKALASFLANFEGITTVIVDAAAIRSGWDDAPIIYAVHRGDELQVHGLGGHGNGSWLDVTVKSHNNIRGSIDVRQTSFEDDVEKGNVYQPTNEKESR
jgi:hypothetical protein